MMVRLQSENGKYYEYDPSNSLIDEDAWGKFYRGVCCNASEAREVRIYELNPSFHLPEYMVRRLKVESHLCYSHPNIIPVIDFYNSNMNEEGDCYLFIGESFKGISLHEIIYGQFNYKDDEYINFAAQIRKSFGEQRMLFAKRVVKEILKGLQFLHDKGLHIGCIDNSNVIFLSNDGNLSINMVNYFISEIHRSSTLFINNMCLPGSFAYYDAPELEYGVIDNRTDFYSVGVILYNILTGKLPEPFSMIRNDYLNEIGDKQMRKIIKKATEKDPAKRFQSAFEFIHAIDKMDEDIPWYKKICSFFSSLLIKNGLRCKFLSLVVAFSFCSKSDAQNAMRVNYKDGSVFDVPIERIDSITFVEKKEEAHEVPLFGEWFWGSNEKGYYEVLSFNEDRTYTGYDYYLDYGYDTWTYGTFQAYGIMLNLWSNGYGYRRTYRWYVTGLTENALEVMTQMGSFIYYRIQPEVYSLKVGEELYLCKDGDYYVFVDGVKVLGYDGKMKGVCEGITYILKYNAESGLIMAYKVIVEK